MSQVIEEFLTEEQEAHLIDLIDAETWVPNRTGSRHVQIYGPYHDKQYRIIPGKYSKHPDHVKWLAKLVLERLHTLTDTEVLNPSLIETDKWSRDDQLEVYINDFPPKSGLRYHFDHRSTYDELICGISLNSDSVLSFKKGNQVIECPIPRRSLYLMYGPYRKQWKHGLQPDHVTDRRVSVTFRTVR